MVSKLILDVFFSEKLRICRERKKERRNKEKRKKKKRKKVTIFNFFAFFFPSQEVNNVPFLGFSLHKV